MARSDQVGSAADRKARSARDAMDTSVGELADHSGRSEQASGLFALSSAASLARAADSASIEDAEANLAAGLAGAFDHASSRPSYNANLTAAPKPSSPTRTTVDFILAARSSEDLLSRDAPGAQLDDDAYDDVSSVSIGSSVSDHRVASAPRVGNLLARVGEAFELELLEQHQALLSRTDALRDDERTLTSHINSLQQESSRLEATSQRRLLESSQAAEALNKLREEARRVSEAQKSLADRLDAAQAKEADAARRVRDAEEVRRQLEVQLEKARIATSRAQEKEKEAHRAAEEMQSRHEQQRNELERTKAEMEKARGLWEKNVREERQQLEKRHAEALEARKNAEIRVREAEALEASVLVREKALRDLKSMQIQVREEEFKLEALKAQTQKEAEDLAREKTRWRADKGLLEDAEQEIGRLKKRLAQAETDKGRLEALENGEAQLAKVRVQLEGQTSTVEKQFKILRAREAAVARIETEREKMVETVQQAKRELAEAVQARRRANQAEQAACNAERSLTRDLERLRQDRALLGNLEEREKAVKVQESSLAETKVKLEALESKLSEQQAELEKSSRELQEKEKKHSSSENALAILQAEIDEKSAIVKYEQAQLEEKRKQYDKDWSIKSGELASGVKALEDKKKELQGDQDRLAEERRSILEDKNSLKIREAEVSARENAIRLAQAQSSTREKQFEEQMMAWHREQNSLKEEAEKTLAELLADRNAVAKVRKELQDLKDQEAALVHGLEERAKKVITDRETLDAHKTALEKAENKLILERTELEHLRSKVEDEKQRLAERESKLQSEEKLLEDERKSIQDARRSLQSDTALWQDADGALQDERVNLVREREFLQQRELELDEQLRNLDEREVACANREVALAQTEQRLQALRESLNHERQTLKKKMALARQDAVAEKKRASVRIARARRLDIRVKEELRAASELLQRRVKEVENREANLIETSNTLLTRSKKLDEESQSIREKKRDLIRSQTALETKLQSLKKQIAEVRKRERALAKRATAVEFQAQKIHERDKRHAVEQAQEQTASSHLAKRLESYGEELQRRLKNVSEREQRQKTREREQRQTITSEAGRMPVIAAVPRQATNGVLASESRTINELMKEIKNIRMEQEQGWRREVGDIERAQRAMENRLLDQTRALANRQQDELKVLHEAILKVQRQDQDYALQKMEALVKQGSSAAAAAASTNKVEAERRQMLEQLSAEREALQSRQQWEREALEVERRELNKRIQQEWETIRNERYSTLQRNEELVSQIQEDPVSRHPPSTLNLGLSGPSPRANRGKKSTSNDDDTNALNEGGSEDHQRVSASPEIENLVKEAVKEVMEEKARLDDELSQRAAEQAREHNKIEEERRRIEEELARHRKQIEVEHARLEAKWATLTQDESSVTGAGKRNNLTKKVAFSDLTSESHQDNSAEENDSEIRSKMTTQAKLGRGRAQQLEHEVVQDQNLENVVPGNVEIGSDASSEPLNRSGMKLTSRPTSQGHHLSASHSMNSSEISKARSGPGAPLHELQSMAPLLVARARNARAELAKAIVEKETLAQNSFRDFLYIQEEEVNEEENATSDSLDSKKVGKTLGVVETELEESDDEVNDEYSSRISRMVRTSPSTGDSHQYGSRQTNTSKLKHLSATNDVEESEHTSRANDKSHSIQNKVQNEESESEERSEMSRVRQTQLSQLDTLDSQIKSLLHAAEASMHRLKRLTSLLTPIKSEHLTQPLSEDMCEIAADAVKVQAHVFKQREELLADEELILGSDEVEAMRDNALRLQKRQATIEERFQELIQQANRLVHLQHQRDLLYQGNQQLVYGMGSHERAVGTEDEEESSSSAYSDNDEDPSSYHDKLRNCLQMLEKSLKTREDLLKEDGVAMDASDVHLGMIRNARGANADEVVSDVDQGTWDDEEEGLGKFGYRKDGLLGEDKEAGSLKSGDNVYTENEDYEGEGYIEDVANDHMAPTRNHHHLHHPRMFHGVAGGAAERLSDYRSVHTPPRRSQGGTVDYFNTNFAIHRSPESGTLESSFADEDDEEQEEDGVDGLAGGARRRHDIGVESGFQGSPIAKKNFFQVGESMMSNSPIRHSNSSISVNSNNNNNNNHNHNQHHYGENSDNDDNDSLRRAVTGFAPSPLRAADDSVDAGTSNVAAMEQLRFSHGSSASIDRSGMLGLSALGEDDAEGLRSSQDLRRLNLRLQQLSLEMALHGEDDSTLQRLQTEFHRVRSELEALS